MDSEGGVVKSREKASRDWKICPHCKSAARLENGLCLNCLLRSALDGESPGALDESFKETLAALKTQNAQACCGDYEILEEIGRGGMAVIFRARELPSDRIVALKRAKADYLDSDQALARFRREAETAATLNHPNIVPVYFVGENAQGVPFFTMKLASGGNLVQARDALRNQPRQSVLIMTKVARAVQYAHGRGVLHRDLKPGNILLDDPWEPLVSDFGLARWQNDSSRFTHTLTSFGTPGYLAPEQARGSQASLTPAADIYSLGAILFELLTRRPPFLGENPLAVIQQAVEKSAPKLRQFAGELDRDLETICARCLEYEPSARYQSAGDLAADLQSWLDERPIMARPPGVQERFGRWLKRHPARASLIGVSLLLVGASLFWQIHSRRLQSVVWENTLAARSVLVMPLLDLDTTAVDLKSGESIARSLRREIKAIGPAQIKSPSPGISLYDTSADEVRKICQSLKTRTLLTGTTRVVEGKKRIALRLLDGRTGEPLFIHVSQEVADSSPDKFIDEKIGEQLYAILSAKDWSNLLPSRIDPGFRNGSAKEAMLAGRELMRRYTAPDLDRAIVLFRKATQIEPNSPLAHAYLAGAATCRTHYISDRSFLELGKEEARKALQLSPDLSDAHRALAGVYYQEGKFPEALQEQMRTLELGGMEETGVSFIGLTLDTLGRSDQAIRWYALVSKLERVPGTTDPVIGDCWTKLGDDERAHQAYARAADLQPNSPQGQLGICHLRVLQGNFDGARELQREAGWDHGDLSETQQIAAQIEFFARNFEDAEKLYSDLSGRDSDGGGSFYGAISYRSALGRVRQARGDRTAKALLKRCLVDERIAVQREPENPEAFYRLAAVESSLGEREHSLQHLRTAANLGWSDYRSLAMDPRFDAVRQSSEFTVIIAELSAKVREMRIKAHKHTETANSSDNMEE
jgi:serine/threonine protein kinase/tetratricopeptide (TPR) repeat protein